MNKLILCEGETDAILLSYYLERTCGWGHCKAPNGLDIKTEKVRGESAHWYCRGDEHLLICAVGSKDNFHSFFECRISRPLFDSDGFSRIALMLDRDTEEISDIEANIQKRLPAVAANAKNNCWVNQEYQNSFGQMNTLDFLILIIPQEQQGALETLLLEAISEDAYDKNCARLCGSSRAHDYVEGMQEVSSCVTAASMA